MSKMVVWNGELSSVEVMASKSKQKWVNAAKKISAASAFQEAGSRKSSTSSSWSSSAVSSHTEQA